MKSIHGKGMSLEESEGRIQQSRTTRGLEKLPRLTRSPFIVQSKSNKRNNLLGFTTYCQKVAETSLIFSNFF